MNMWERMSNSIATCAQCVFKHVLLADDKMANISLAWASIGGGRGEGVGNMSPTSKNGGSISNLPHF